MRVQILLRGFVHDNLPKVDVKTDKVTLFLKATWNSAPERRDSF